MGELSNSKCAGNNGSGVGSAGQSGLGQVHDGEYTGQVQRVEIHSTGPGQGPTPQTVAALGNPCSHLQDLNHITHNVHCKNYRVCRLNKSHMLLNGPRLSEPGPDPWATSGASKVHRWAQENFTGVPSTGKSWAPGVPQMLSSPHHTPVSTAYIKGGQLFFKKVKTLNSSTLHNCSLTIIPFSAYKLPLRRKNNFTRSEALSSQIHRIFSLIIIFSNTTSSCLFREYSRI